MEKVTTTTRFKAYKERETFQTKVEAKAAMEQFLQLVVNDQCVFGPIYRGMLKEQCEEVLNQLECLQFPQLDDNETCEWLITLMGVALVTNHYDLSMTDEDESSGVEIPWDFESRALCSVESRYECTLQDLIEASKVSPGLIKAAIAYGRPTWHTVPDDTGEIMVANSIVECVRECKDMSQMRTRCFSATKTRAEYPKSL